MYPGLCACDGSGGRACRGLELARKWERKPSVQSWHRKRFHRPRGNRSVGACDKQARYRNRRTAPSGRLHMPCFGVCQGGDRAWMATTSLNDETDGYRCLALAPNWTLREIGAILPSVCHSPRVSCDYEPQDHGLGSNARKAGSLRSAIEVDHGLSSALETAQTTVACVPKATAADTAQRPHGQHSPRHDPVFFHRPQRGGAPAIFP